MRALKCAALSCGYVITGLGFFAGIVDHTVLVVSFSVLECIFIFYRYFQPSNYLPGHNIHGHYHDDAYGMR